MKIQTSNPATDQRLSEYDVMTEEQVNAIVTDVHTTYLSWKQVPLQERADLIRKIADALRSKKDEYAQMMSEEMGKPLKDALGEVEKCAWCAEVYADNAEEWSKGESIEVDGVKHEVIYQPLGVILAIMPWNFPFWQAFRFAIPTLLAGNTAVLKHASNVTGSALGIEQVFTDAGFPENAFRTIIAGHETVSNLMSSSHIRGVSLTGSTNAGKRIAEAAGKNLKKVVLELGGSDPFIVLEDADLDIAVKGAMTGRFMNCGQSCIASKRFIVVESLVEEFGKKFAEAASQLKVGDPNAEDTNLGPLVNKQAVDDIDAMVQDAKDKGATILTGGERIGENGCFYAPTVITNTTTEMKVVHDETFGPVAAIISVKDEHEAIAVANSLEFGLGGSVWTKDLKRGEQVALQIESGTVFVNSITKSDPRMPFGGIKESGLGRELSKYGMREFVNLKGLNVYEHK